MSRKTIGNFINNAPAHHCKAKTLNRMGLQIVRTLWQHGKHSLRAKPRLEGLEKKCEALDRDGVVTIPNFLPDDVFEKVVAEYQTAKQDSTGKWRRPSSCFGLKGWASIIVPDDPEFAQTNAAMREHKTIKDLVSYITRRKVDFFPSTMSFLDQELEEGWETTTDGTAFLHADTHYPTSKVVLYLTDVTEEDAPFVYCYGSHRLNWSRIMLEHDMANRATNPGRYPKDEVINGFPVINDALIKKYGLDPGPVVAPKNTLIIANHFGLHKHDTFHPGRHRATLRVSFRFLDTPRYLARFLPERLRKPY